MSTYFDSVTLLKNSPFAWWEWDVVTNKVVFNELKVTMLGYDPADFKDKGYEVFTGLLHPDDYLKAMNAMMIVLKGESELYQVDYRIKAKSGEYRLYMDRGTVIEKVSNNKPARIRGIVIDLGRESEVTGSVDSLIGLLKATVKDYPSDKKSFLVVCSNCKKAKYEKNLWIDISPELYQLVGEDISHGICPDCIRVLYPDLFDKIAAKFKLS